MKTLNRVGLFLVFLILLFFTGQPVQASDSLSGIQIFPKDHIWNVPVDTLPVDTRSEIYMNSINSDAPYIVVSASMPFNIVNSSVTHKHVTFTQSWSPEQGDGYPIPDDPLIERGSDHHLLIVDRDALKLYELYNVKQASDGTWSADSGAIFDLTDYQLREIGLSSADAAGLPIVPGLLRYDELMSGEVDHALRINVLYTNRSYLWPARNFASDFRNGTFPPMGQRIRLKASFDTSGYPPQSKAILEVLKKHGAMVSDNGASFTLSAEPDSRWSYNDLVTMREVSPTYFEAVDVSSIIINKDSGQTLINPVVTTTPTTTPISLFAEENNGQNQLNKEQFDLGEHFNKIRRILLKIFQ
jgi:hypothetical protein